MLVLLRNIHNVNTIKKRSVGFLWFFLISNALFYVFLLYYSMIELVVTNGLTKKLQVAISVFFILELDNWMYHITIEPMKILEDSIFLLHLRGFVLYLLQTKHARFYLCTFHRNPGSQRRRYRQVAYWFWSVFFSLLMLEAVLYWTKSVDKVWRRRESVVNWVNSSGFRLFITQNMALNLFRLLELQVTN